MGKHHPGPAKLIISIQGSQVFVHSLLLINCQQETFSLCQWLLKPASAERVCLLVDTRIIKHLWPFEGDKEIQSTSNIFLASSRLRSSSEFSSYWNGVLFRSLEKATESQSLSQVYTAMIRINDLQENARFFLSFCGATAGLEMWTGLQFPKVFSSAPLIM